MFDSTAQSKFALLLWFFSVAAARYDFITHIELGRVSQIGPQMSLRVEFFEDVGAGTSQKVLV